MYASSIEILPSRLPGYLAGTFAGKRSRTSIASWAMGSPGVISLMSDGGTHDSGTLLREAYILRYASPSFSASTEGEAR